MSTPTGATRSFRPIGPAELVTELSEWLIERRALGGHRWDSLRVGVDGPPAADPAAVADGVVEHLTRRSVPAWHVRADDFLRDASVRLEYGREDQESYARGWLDGAALRREVLEPLAPDRVDPAATLLPSLRDPRTNRATRARPVSVPADSVVLLSGALLLNYDLPLESMIHLSLSEGALHRRTPPELGWTIPAFADYERQARPMERAAVTVRLEDPLRPAIRYRTD